MEIIWLAWAVSAAASISLTIFAANRISWRQFKQILIREDGAAYTLNYAITIPFYILMVCAFVDTSFMLVSKMGSVYASFAAARSAIVWDNISPGSNHPQRTAIKTMAPLASGFAEMRHGTSGAWGSANGDERNFVRAYTRSGGGYANYVRAKYRYAKRATTTTVDIQRMPGGRNVWDENVVATVTYDYPFLTPVIGRALGASKMNGPNLVQEITSIATLQNETPQNKAKHLGINYGP